MISAIVLTGGKVDEILLEKCLASLDWVDEVVQFVGKNGSFADWRNEATKQAKGDWLLYVDYDEEVTKELEKEVQEVIRSDEVAAYAIPRRNFIFGKEMKHSGLWPDYVLRLIKKDKLIAWKGDLHEQPKIKGSIAHLKSPLIHRKHDNLSDMVDKTNKWSEIEARLMLEAGHPKMNFFRFFTAGFREFWLRMIKQMAFLDGAEGVIYGLYQVYSRLISYAKLWELQNN